MRRTLTLAAGALTALALLAPATNAAGVVDVRFAPPDQMADIGRATLDGERNLQVLARHFQSLAQRLPDGQTLAVTVLDVDLAGEMRPTRRGSDLRVMNGGVDWPMLSLRWSLSEGGRTLAGGEERLTDMAYLSATRRAASDSELPYETRLIDRWFDERFGAAAAR